MTLETLDRSRLDMVAADPVIRDQTLETAADTLDGFYKSIGVDPLSRAQLRASAVTPSEERPLSRKQAVSTITIAMEAAEAQTFSAFTYANTLKRVSTARSAAERTRRLARKGDVFRATPPKANSMPARLR